MIQNFKIEEWQILLNLNIGANVNIKNFSLQIPCFKVNNYYCYNFLR